MFVMCYDKVSRKAKVRALLNKNVDLIKAVLFSFLCSFQDTHSDILYVYTDDDKDKLVNANVICESFTKTGARLPTKMILSRKRKKVICLTLNLWFR